MAEELHKKKKEEEKKSNSIMCPSLIINCQNEKVAA